jgi:hypothetical protein
MPEEIRYLGDLQLLKVEPGDKFVLTLDHQISQEHADGIKALWHKFAGDDVPLLVLERGMKLGAIRTTPEEPA